MEKLDAGKTAKQLFQRRALNRKEFEEIRSLSSDQPTKAAEQLLQLVLSQSEDFYDCFLDSLLKTDQTHVHQWIVLEGLLVQNVVFTIIIIFLYSIIVIFIVSNYFNSIVNCK